MTLCVFFACIFFALFAFKLRQPALKQPQMKKNITIFSLSLVFIISGNSVTAQSLNIKNDVFWNTQDGRPIYSQGGGIFRFKDSATAQEKYYWYGVHYKEAEIYRNDPSIT